MFGKFTYIEETHRIALESAIRNHAGITSQLAAKLYKHALDAALTKTSHENGFFHSRVETASYAIGTCTDAKTGYFVQLVSKKNDPHLLLTIGHKWAMENVDTMRGNTNTVFW